MHKIESPGATQDSRFTEGDPSSGVPATELSAAFMNAVMDEIANVIQEAGLTLKTAGTETGDQLLAALQSLGMGGYASAAEAQALTSLVKVLTPGRLDDAFEGANQLKASRGYQRLPGGGILQWGIKRPLSGANSYNVDTVFPIAFPNACFSVVVSHGVDSANLDSVANYRTNDESVQMGAPNTTGFDAQLNLRDGQTSDNRAFRWMAIGH
ncbi:hypothetical protein NFH98_20710 [Halomonas sp. H33-56]|uniref:gp53-like domain-containing protein n=1 Tax=Halomonas sp. H33-56 TaxID=2950873 RepID=UPI0032DFE4EE